MSIVARLPRITRANTPAATAIEVSRRPLPGAVWQAGSANRCPSCCSAQFHVGRTTAECARCGHPLTIARSTHLNPVQGE